MIGQAYQQKPDPFGDIALNGDGGRINPEYGTPVSFD